MSSVDGSVLLRELREVALVRGADAVSVTSSDPLGDARVAIEERKAAGLHAGMHFTYGHPERSTTPRRLVSDARSVVVALRRYPGEETSGPSLVAEVASYVRRDEYAQLGVALDAMADVLVAKGFVAEVVMDDNRLVDRAVAARAGLGWLGRNTMLLHPDLGSWTVIGAVVTDAELPVADGPLADGCGSCRRCQVECPTGALDTAGVLDANRCLAWLVQATGRFPAEHRRALGQRIYGCDDCQVVCPVNDRVDPPSIEAPALNGPVDLLALLDASDDELTDLYGHWYIPRRQPDYLRRNALVALGNTDPGALGGDSDRVHGLLARLLRTASPLVRGHALWAAEELGFTDLVDAAFDDPSFTDEDPDGFAAAERALVEAARATGEGSNR